jgi:hypothetical protein
MTPYQLIISGLVIVFISVVFYLVFVSPKRKFNSQLLTSKNQQIRYSIDHIYVELQEFSREVISKIDTRIKILNQLLIEADEKIKKFERLSKTETNSPPKKQLPVAALDSQAPSVHK